MYLYKRAMNLEENNRHLVKRGYPPIFQDDDVNTAFSKPVPLFGVTYTNEGTVIKEHLFKRRDGRDYIFDPIKGGGYDINLVFASKEFAEAVEERIQFIMEKKVIYENEEYFVHDCLDPRQVGIHKKSKGVTIYDLMFVPVDQLELAE